MNIFAIIIFMLCLPCLFIKVYYFFQKEMLRYDRRKQAKIRYIRSKFKK